MYFLFKMGDIPASYVSLPEGSIFQRGGIFFRIFFFIFFFGPLVPWSPGPLVLWSPGARTPNASGGGGAAPFPPTPLQLFHFF